MNISQTTTSYENWLSTWTIVDQAGLVEKRKKMKKSPFGFFRGSFYHWIKLWIDDDLLQGMTMPEVLSVGDIHLENFGLWRDLEGRLVWGVNDFDEAVVLPYLHDVIRLCVSARVAEEVPVLPGGVDEAVGCIWSGYKAAIRAGIEKATPCILGLDNQDWLTVLANQQIKGAQEYFEKFRKKAIPLAAEAVPEAARAALLALWPSSADANELQWFSRIGGLGSLGRPRYFVSGLWYKAEVIREAKALVPSAWYWASEDHKPITFQLGWAARQAVRSPDPWLREIDQWVVRRIAPDCEKLELVLTPDATSETTTKLAETYTQLLGAMGRELANVHLGTGKGVDLQGHIETIDDAWLSALVKAHTDRILESYTQFKDDV